MAIEYVEFVTKVPLWRSIPEEQRVTEADVRRYATRYRMADRFIERYVPRLEEPNCEIAVRLPEFQKKWAPCGQSVADGATRCRRHGGPSSRQTPASRVAALEAQVAKLRDQLAAANSCNGSD